MYDHIRADLIKPDTKMVADFESLNIMFEMRVQPGTTV